MDKMSEKEIYNEWIEIANIDYELAKRVFEEHWPKQYISICYHCQQAAEKYLKGYLAYNGIEAEKTHVLENILDVCKKHNNSFIRLEDMCEYLTPFATQVRYPKNNYHITDVEARKALEYVKTIIDFVTTKVDTN